MSLFKVNYDIFSAANNMFATLNLSVIYSGLIKGVALS